MAFSDVAQTLQSNLEGFSNTLLLPDEATSLLIFFAFLLLSLLIGRYTPGLVNLVLHRFFPQRVSEIYDKIIEPVKGPLRWAGSLVLISLSMVWIAPDLPRLHAFLKPFVDLAVIASVAWLASRLVRQLMRTYGIDLIQRLGLEADEMLLIVETLVNVIIGLFAVLAFAQSQNINLIGLVAGLGIGGIAIAFAAQKTLEQLIGTAVLYLDRPFVRGDYIRVGLSAAGKPVYGRVESIGLRSTKLRSAATSTLVIVPNSTMANLDIENISRGKKVMVLLYLDFLRHLEQREQALVEQVVKEGTDALFGIDPGSTTISLFNPDDRPGTRARVSFFILGSSENSIQLRKRLLELANETISKKLISYGIEFRVQEPTIYVESPITI